MSSQLQKLATTVGSQARCLAEQSEALRQLLENAHSADYRDRDAALIQARCRRTQAELQNSVSLLIQQAKATYGNLNGAKATVR